jgi:hypothetical protein
LNIQKKNTRQEIKSSDNLHVFFYLKRRRNGQKLFCEKNKINTRVYLLLMNIKIEKGNTGQ